jgi:adenylate kinase
MIDLVRKVSYFHSGVNPSQKYLLLFGAPGVGKGTYAKLLQRDLGLLHISTGDEIRRILKGPVSAQYDESLIAKILSIVRTGGLVSDEVVLDILREKVGVAANGVILDGFPRTRAQL